MFGIGTSEFLVIMLVAVLVLGPEHLPRIMRTFNKVMSDFRRISTDFQRTINLEASQEEWRKQQAEAAPVKKKKKKKPAPAAPEGEGNAETAASPRPEASEAATSDPGTAATPDATSDPGTAATPVAESGTAVTAAAKIAAPATAMGADVAETANDNAGSVPGLELPSQGGRA